MSAAPAVTLENITSAVEGIVAPVNDRLAKIEPRLAALDAINTRIDEIDAARKEGFKLEKSELDELVRDTKDLRDQLRRKVQIVDLDIEHPEALVDMEAGYRFDAKGHIVPSVSRKCAEWFRDAMGAKTEGYAEWVKGSLNRDMHKLSFVRDTTQLNSGAGTVGGFVVPPEYRPELLKLLTVYGLARKIFRFIPMDTNKLTMPALDGESQVYEIGENVAPTETKPTVALFTLNATIYASLVHIPLRLIMMANPGIVQIVIESLFRAFARNEDYVGFVGNKNATDPQSGLTYAFNGVLYTPTSGNTNSRGNANAVVMSSGKTHINDIDFPDIQAMIDATPSPALEGAEFEMNRTVLSQLRAKRDAIGDYIAGSPIRPAGAPRGVLVDASNGQPDTLFDFPIRKVEAMPKSSAASTPSKPFVALLNPNYMALGDQMQPTIAQDTSIGFKEGNLWVRGMEFIGFEATVKDAITVLYTAAS